MNNLHLLSCTSKRCLILKHFKFLLHTKIAYDMRVYHDLDPRSFGQGQVHYQEKCKILFYGETLEVLTSYKYCLLPEGLS